LKPTEEIDCIRITKNTRNQQKETIVKEARLDLYVDGEYVNHFLYSSEFEKELVFGHLHSTGRMFNASDVDSIVFDDEICRVSLRKEDKSDLFNTCLQNTISFEKLLEIRDLLVRNQSNHKATRGFHGAILYELTTGRWFVCEDIGRHNTVDKVLGYGLLEGYSLVDSLLLVSGRLISDIVSKGTLAGIPLLGSMTVATAEGVKLSSEHNQTLVGCLSEEGCWLYHEGTMKVKTDIQ
jgi:FdhD protein